MRSTLVLFPLLLAVLPAQAYINGYAQVTALSGPTLTIGVSDETAAAFAVGKDIVIMQMQDDVIGGNTNDDASFGNLDNIHMAGKYVVRRIQSVARSGPALTSITLTQPLGMTFRTGTHMSVQAITFELFGAGGDFTTTTNISALPWNGSIGGVLAFQVGGALTVAHNITADAAGFRGGARDPSYYSTPCNGTTYRTSSTDANTNQFATKGEGIYKLVDAAWADGRGKILTGGGGGNMINSGGGGGGNFTQGGNALTGWSCATDVGGIGGIALNTHISASRVFLGGGGGGGEGNDNVSTDGGRGGGIILIKAAQIRTTGTCAGGVRISADGATAANSGNDGGGGGGAGGSIILHCPSFTFGDACALQVRANGGNGGSVNTFDTHGGGAGGGQGVVIFSSAQPTGNLTVHTVNGIGGCDLSSCATRAQNGGGTNDTGILSVNVGVLPIELLAFTAVPDGRQVRTEWSTGSEHDNVYFTVERSGNLQQWTAIGDVAGAGNSLSRNDYSLADMQPVMGDSYYRLRQTDVDGTSTLSAVVPVRIGEGPVRSSVFPNPSTGLFTVRISGASIGSVEVLNGLGQQVGPVRRITEGHAEMDLTGLPMGAYIIVVRTAESVLQERLVLRY